MQPMAQPNTHMKPESKAAETPCWSLAVSRRQASFEREAGLDSSSYVALNDDELDDLVYQDFLEERQETMQVNPPILLVGIRA